jgi:hypothetical protein
VTVLRSTVDRSPTGHKTGNGTDSPARRRFQLNGPVNLTPSEPATAYGLARPLGLRLVGRSLVTLGGLVVVATIVGVVSGAGWLLAGVVAAAGLIGVGGWAWYLLRRAVALRLTSERYVVRLFGGVGVASAAWSDVAEVTAATSGGTPCLVLRLRDGRSTRLPMVAVAGDADSVAYDVQRRVRDAHS